MTKATRIALLAILSWAVIAAQPLRAAEQPHAYVVLVGVSDYADKQIKPRAHAEDDARALYDLFTDKQFADPDRTDVKLLLGGKDDKRPSEAATKENILKALHWAIARAGKDDPIVFAFFGEGAPLDKRLCLFGSDGEFKNRAESAVTMAEIEKELDALKSQHFVALLDANFNGFDAGADKVGAPNMTDLSRTFLGKGEKDDQPSALGRVVLLANNGRRASLDLEKQGIFVTTLLEALQGAADKAGYESDGIVSADELIQFLEKRLPELARANGKTKEDKEQTPTLLGSRADRTALTHNPAAWPRAKERLEKFDTLVEDQKLPADVTTEGRRVLAQMPGLPAEQELRKLYQKFADGTQKLPEFQKNRERLLAEIKLLHADSTAFAAKVMEGVKLLQRTYLKDLNQGEMVGWAIQGLCQRPADKPVLAALQDRLDKTKKFKEADLIALLIDARERLGKRADLANNHDVDAALRQVATKLDPHTTYVDPQRLEDFKRQMSGAYTGIGVRIGKDTVRDMPLVITPVKDSPAYKAGLRAGDIITVITREVDNKGKKLAKPEVTPTKGLPISEAMSKVLGEAGTDVKLTIERPGSDKPMEVTVTRGPIQEETVIGVRRKDDDEWDYMLDKENKIGYIRLTQFTQQTTPAIKKAMEDLAKEGVRAVVLDLRFNPGGLLQTAIDVSSMFGDDGLVVTIKPRTGTPQNYHGSFTDHYLKFPMAVLINGGSASASEVVSACLQDQKRAVMVGERSYGKGSVQNIVDFKPTGGQMKMTTATFWRPNGKNLNKASTKGTEAEDWGVRPDKGFEVRLPGKQRDELMQYQRDLEIIGRHDGGKKDVKPMPKDDQLDKALGYLRGQMRVADEARAKSE